MSNDNSTSFVEVDDTDSGSGYETNSTNGTGSDTTSLSSSLQQWMVENGRRYHTYYGPDKNMMPTDEVEQDRLDIHHEIMLLITNRELYKAPIDKPQRVLDLGTGTGIWAIDYAFDHPEAEVIGIDLSPIQPNWVPPNCRFEVDDFELDWTFKKGSFEFIHARNICHSVKQWPELLAQVMSHLQPGAWFESAELGTTLFSDDDTLPSDWAPKVCFDLGREALEKLGRIIPTAEWMEKLLTDAGFVDVEVKTYKEPLTAWPKNKDLKQAGALMTLSAETAYNAYMMSLLTRVMDWSAEDAAALCKKAEEAHYVKKSGVHAYVKYHIGYGRKPLETEV